MPTLPLTDRITVGTTVTSATSSYDPAATTGTVTEIRGTWARVRWDRPAQRESLEWLGSLLPIAASKRPSAPEPAAAAEDPTARRTGG